MQIQQQTQDVGDFQAVGERYGELDLQQFDTTDDGARASHSRHRHDRPTRR